MNARQKLLLAVCIGEWATALDHVNAAISTGYSNPVPYAAQGRVRRELHFLLREWASVTDRLLVGDDDHPAMVQEARTYCTQHQAEIELLNGTEGET